MLRRYNKSKSSIPINPPEFCVIYPLYKTERSVGRCCILLDSIASKHRIIIYIILATKTEHLINLIGQVYYYKQSLFFEIYIKIMCKGFNDLKNFRQNSTRNRNVQT